MGWNLSLPSIKRKTDKNLPQYFDVDDSDTFLFSEAEDLVPEFEKEIDGSLKVDLDGEYIINEKDSRMDYFELDFTNHVSKGFLHGLNVGWRNQPA